MPDMIKLVIADDHALVRECLRHALEGCPAMVVVGEAANGDEAIRRVRETRPDVLLLDLAMPQSGGIPAVRAIKSMHLPGGHPPRVLVLTSLDDEASILEAIKAGADGYLLKDIEIDALIKTIQSVHNGYGVLHQAIIHKVLGYLQASPAHGYGPPPAAPPLDEPLTQRETEVLALLAEGMTNEQIALRLAIGDRTVATHVGNILSKLQVGSRVQAALYAVRSGLVPLAAA